MNNKREKLSNERFLELTDKMDKKMDAAKEKYGYSNDYFSNRKKILEELIAEIAKYDLSDVEISSWPMNVFINPDKCTIDLTNTNARIDFKTIIESEYRRWVSLENINLHGCYIENLDWLTGRINYHAVDDETRRKYPKIFLDDSYSEDFRIRFCNHELTIEDYINFSKEEIKSLNIREHLLYHYGNLLKIIDDDDKISKFIRTNEDYNKLINLANRILCALYYSFSPDDQQEEAKNLLKELKNSSASEWESIIYKYTSNKLRNTMSKIGNINDYPKKFIEENRDIFLLDKNIPDDLRERYYQGKLKLEDFLDNDNFLSVKIDIGKIDEEFYLENIIVEHKEELSHMPKEKEPFIRKIVQMMENNSKLKDYILYRNLELERALRCFDVSLYIEYKASKEDFELPLEELLKRSLESNKGLSSIYRKAIELFGIENILEFEKETGLITKEKNNIKSYYFIELMSRLLYCDDIKKIEDLFIYDIKKKYSYETQKTYKDIDYLHNKFFSSIMLEEEKLVGLGEEEKKYIINKFYKGELNYTDLKKYPILKEILKEKDLEFILRENFLHCYGGSSYTNVGFHTYGNYNSIILDLWEKYGRTFSRINLKLIRDNIIGNKDITKEKIEQKINQIIYEDIINQKNIDFKEIGHIIFDDELFLKQYPEFLIKEENFKEGELEQDWTLEELANNLDFVKRLETFSVALLCDEDYYWITEMFRNSENPYEANLNRLVVMLNFSKIKDDYIVAEEFKKYYLKHKNDITNIEEVIKVLQGLSYTNSSTLYSLRKSLTEQLLETENPTENFNKIEKIFIKNNIPLYGKMFNCFQILYPNIDKHFDFTDNSRMAPELKNKNIENIKISGCNDNNSKRFRIIYNDLLRIAINSNSIDMQNYLDNIEQGNDIFNKLSEGQVTYEELSEEDKKIIEVFENHLETIYESTNEGQKNPLDLTNLSINEKLEVLKSKFSPTERYDLKDRIVRMFAYTAGYKSFDEVKNAMKNAKKQADERGRKYAEQLNTKKFELEDGDFIRCIGDYQTLGSSLDNGNFSKEYLSTIINESSSDTTPLDIDWSLINKKETIYNSIYGTPTGFGFGNVYMVIKKDNPNINITRDSGGNEIETKYDSNKIEMFGTMVNDYGWKTHYGARTGIALTDIDYILYKKNSIIDNNEPYDANGNVNYTENSENDYDDLRAIKFEIARHGYYIPVVDFAGKLIFTVEEYEELRKQINGLSHYKEENYNFSNNLVTEEIEEIRKGLEVSKKDTKKKRNQIYKLLSETLKKYNLSVKENIDGDLTQGTIEIIDTGSTGRATNEVGDGDFDLLLRLDRNIILNTKLYNQLKQDIKDVINTYNPEEFKITDRGDYRIKGATLEDGSIVDIDLTFDNKTDKLSYTTDECIRDRLDTLKRIDKEKYEYVVANIILAKRVLKNYHAYKSKNSNIPEGGLGGVGVENWILEHGGSFIDAANSFLEVAKNKSFEEFKQIYTVWDYGENHLAERKEHYAHDNFVNDNMSAEGYEKMVQALEEYVNKYNLESEKGINK